jgi:ABC-type polar amino acid transport system ATPase subunit
MNFSRDVSDRVIFMDGGQVVEDTDPETMFTKPSNERARSFLRAVLDR